MAATSNGNFLVAAFDADGNELWTRELDITGEEDWVTGVAADSAGNTLVVGPVGSGFGGFETVMLDISGDLVWTDNEFGEFGSTLGRAIVAIDADDEIVVSAVPESTCGLFQVRTWRLTPEGLRLWTRSFPESPCDSADLADMELDRDGNAVVLSQSLVLSEGGWHNFTTIKYDADGNELWRRTLANEGVDIPTALDIDRAGNAYITGAAGLANNTYDGMAASYSPAGSLRWTKFFASGAPNDRPADIVAGQRGEVYVTGMGFFQPTNDDIVTIKLQQSLPAAPPQKR
jgi:outer membrane protein assembly factor BamB